jgi:hypothetical protein
MKAYQLPAASKWLMLFSISVLFFSSCKKQTDQAPNPQELSSVVNRGNNENRIYVSDISQLYAAVNDPANTGSKIILAPGTYILDPNHPKAGRIELLENMELQGQPGHPEQVIIDASALPATSFNPPLNFPTARTGAIRIGKGANAIEWLTILGNSSQSALSVIDADLVSTPVALVRIAHCVVTGGRIGINLRNPSSAANGRILEAQIADNEIKENLVEFGQGIELQNAAGANGAIIRVTLHGNYVHGNKVGMGAWNNNSVNTVTNSNSISIQSNGDRFDENGIGIFLNAGLNQGTTTTANENFLQLEAQGTSIQNNIGVPPPYLFNPVTCGIYAAGGLSLRGGAADVSGNRLEISLWGCPISGNLGRDITAYGAFSNSAILAGTNNVVNIYLHGVTANATVNATPSFPAEPAGTNTVNIFR